MLYSPPIDWMQCIELMSGNDDLAKKLLILFMQHLPESQRNIQLAYQEMNLQRLSEQLHKLYGACCYCAVPNLTRVIDQMSSAVKAGLVEQVKALYLLLDGEIQAVQQAYERLSIEGILK